MMLVISKVTLLIEHSDVFERVREHGHTARSTRVTTKVLYASLPVSELSRLPPLRDNPLCRRRHHRRAPARPFQPLPLRQPYPWSFSHTTPPLAINAREKVGARLRSRPLRTPSSPSLPISFSLSLSPSHFFWPLCFSRRITPFLSISLMLLHRFARLALKYPRLDKAFGMQHPDPIERQPPPPPPLPPPFIRYIGRSHCQSESRPTPREENPRNKIPSRYRARSTIDRFAVSSRVPA